jgi:predicted cupin superfamily sugar epimerase
VTADELVERLNLSPHPEGGYYRETFRSEVQVQTEIGSRSAGTSILYMLAGDDVSRFHRIDADEIWYFHEGAPLTIYCLEPNGDARCETLSASNPQLTVPAGVWFGAALEEPNSYALVSCAVTPGFEFAEFELAEHSILLERWPDAKDWIEKLT